MLSLIHIFPPRYIQQFMLELLQPPIQARYRLRVAYSSATAEWRIENKSSVPAHNVAAYTTYGTCLLYTS